MDYPEVITLRITSRCNNACKYCYGPQKNIKELSFSKLKELFHLFSQKGVKAVVLTGGEPLIREDFPEIVKELKKFNFKIFLDTNGDLFFKYSGLITKEVDVLGLPVDFPDKSYRGDSNFEQVIKILDFLKNKSKKPIVRVGTVVTKENINQLQEIGNLLKKYSIDIWKIYEFIPQNNAIKTKSLFEVPQEQFNEVTEEMNRKFSDYTKVVISKRSNRTNAYFFVGSDGEVFIPIDDLTICKEVTIGNVFDSNTLKKWKELVLENNYRDNVKVTFDYNPK